MALSESVSCVSSSNKQQYQLVILSRYDPFQLTLHSSYDDMCAVLWNQQLWPNITGVYCYGNGCLLQYLESTMAELEIFKKRIIEDKDHSDIRIIGFIKTSKRKFATLGMCGTLIEERFISNGGLGQLYPFTPYDWPIEEWRRMLGRAYAYHTKSMQIQQNREKNISYKSTKETKRLEQTQAVIKEGIHKANLIAKRRLGRRHDNSANNLSLNKSSENKSSVTAAGKTSLWIKNQDFIALQVFILIILILGFHLL